MMMVETRCCTLANGRKNERKEERGVGLRKKGVHKEREEKEEWKVM